MIYSLEDRKKVAWAAGMDAANRFQVSQGRRKGPWTFEDYGEACPVPCFFSQFDIGRSLSCL